MKPRLAFPLIMVFLTLMTALKYEQIRRFRATSQEYSFLVASDGDMSSVKEKLENLTYQRVDEEVLYDGKRRIVVRCPPEKLGLVSSILSGARREN